MTLFQNRPMQLFARALLCFFLAMFSGLPVGLAETPERSTTQELIDQAKTALDAQDEQTFEGILNRLFERITGFANTEGPIPDTVSDEEFIRKMCDFDRISEQIYSPEHFSLMRNQLRSAAYAVVRLDKENDVGVRAITECVTEDGRPTKRAQFMLDGLAWAKTFQAANATQAVSMAQDIAALAAQHPDNVHISILDDMVRYDARNKQDAERSKTNDDERHFGTFFPRATLVDKADKGSLPAQLEVARRLETGNKFRQDSAMAYFWYTRALQNGGGKVAQAGMDRILPQLTDVDFIKIDVWTRRDHRPY